MTSSDPTAKPPRSDPPRRRQSGSWLPLIGSAGLVSALLALIVAAAVRGEPVHQDPPTPSPSASVQVGP